MPTCFRARPFRRRQIRPKCVDLGARRNTKLQTRRDDFRQLAYLTILEETPKYDPTHPSQASFITFIKSRVCHRLWSQRRQELRYLPCSFVESGTSEFADDAPTALNPLTAELYNAAVAAESLEDEVIEEIHIEQFREQLPAMLNRLTEQEQEIVRLKYFQDQTGTQIAETLGVSKGRVSQLMKSLLVKLKSVYLRLKDGYPV